MPEEYKTLPVDYERPFEELWKEYLSYHAVSKEENKPKKRFKRIVKHRKSLTKIIEESIGDRDFEDLKESDKKDIAAKIVTKLVHEGYKAIDKNASKPTEEHIRLLLQDVGIGSYEDLLELIINSDTLDYNTLPENSPLRNLIDYIALAKDREGKRIQAIERTFKTRYEHHIPLREAAGKEIGTEYKPSARPEVVLAEYGAYIERKIRDLEAKKPKTYKK